MAPRRTLSHWSSPARRDAYVRAYRDSLGLWPTAYEEIDVASSFGTTHVVASGRAGGEPLVLLPAASLSATQWYLQARELGADYRLHALDIMGDIGRSTARRSVRTAADAAGWLTEVLDELHLDRAVFVGSSFGGFHSTNLAIRAPERVRALVLLAPAATVQPFRPSAAFVIRTGSLLPLPFTVKPGLRSMMQGALPEGRIVRQMELGVAGFRYERGGLFPSNVDDAALARIACPTLLLLGEHERIYDPDRAARRARAVLAADVEILEAAGHLLGMQRPDVVNQHIRTFLARIA